jgi:shikimate dehydrogenase
VTDAVVGPRRAAVLGSPIGHSLSPVLHRAAYAALGLDGWTYEAYDVAELSLKSFLDGLDSSWAGLSLTMPLKAAVLELLDVTSPLVTAVGGANTVLLDGRLRRGENTDVPGIVAALQEKGVDRFGTATVLGGGATARSVVAALARMAGSVTAYVRSEGRATQLRAVAAATGAALQVADWGSAADGLGADLVVNTTVAGAADGLAARLPDATTTLFEVLYDPWPTPLAQSWSARGGHVVNGLDLLVHQAILQVGLMTRASVDVPALVPLLRAAGERALDARG